MFWWRRKKNNASVVDKLQFCDEIKQRRKESVCGTQNWRGKKMKRRNGNETEGFLYKFANKAEILLKDGISVLRFEVQCCIISQ